MHRAALARLLLILAIVIGLILLSQFLHLRVLVHSVLDRVRSLGVWGLALVVLIYTPSALLFFPTWPLTVTVGYLFPFAEGLVVASIGSASGAGVAFLLGRTIGRRWIERHFRDDQRFLALDHAIGQRGFLLVLLTRLSPAFPYALLNFAFSLTRIRFRDFLLATLAGMLPITLLYLYLGSLMESLADPLPSSGIGNRVMLSVGLGATAIVTFVIGRIANRALREIPCPRPPEAAD